MSEPQIPERFVIYSAESDPGGREGSTKREIVEMFTADLKLEGALAVLSDTKVSNDLKRLDIQYVTSLPVGEVCVGITTFRDRIIVATTTHVYRLEDEKLIPIDFQQPNFNCTECSDGTFKYDGIHHLDEQQWGGKCDMCGLTSMFDTKPPK
jgi:hypothetical protein